MALSLAKLASLATQEGVPPELAAAVYQQESSFGTNSRAQNPNAKNAGGFQVDQTLFTKLVPGGDIMNEEDNARAGLRYLKEALTKTGGHIGAAAAYYHAGPNWKEKLEKDPNLSDPLGKKTFDYANEVTANANQFKDVLNSAPSVGNITGPGPQSGGSDRFIPLASNPDEVISGLIGDMTKAYGGLSKEIAAYRTGAAELRAQMDAGLEDFVQKLHGTASTVDTDPAVLLAKATKAAQEGMKGKVVLQAANIDTDDVSNLGVRLLSSIAKGTDESRVLREQIQSKKSVGFLEDPITWIENNLALPDEIRQHNNIVQNVNADRLKLQQLTSGADELVKSNLAKSGLNDALVLTAAAEASQRISAAKVAEARYMGMKQSYAMLNDNFQATSLEIQRISGMAALLERMEGQDDKRKAKELAVQADALKLKQANDIGQMLGLPAFTSAKDVDRLPAKQKEAFMISYQSGGRRFTNNQDPVEALSVATSGNINKMSLGNQVLIDFTREALRKTQSAISAQETKMQAPMSATARKEGAINGVKKLFEEMQADTGVDLIPNRHENPYRMADIKTMISFPVVAKTKLAEIVRTYIQQNPAVNIDDRMIADIARQAFISGTGYNNIQEAAKDLEVFFTAARSYNNETYNFNGWGLPEQQEYRFNGTDWSNYGEVATTLARKGAVEIARKSLLLNDQGSRPSDLGISP